MYSKPKPRYLGVYEYIPNSIAQFLVYFIKKDAIVKIFISIQVLQTTSLDIHGFLGMRNKGFIVEFRSEIPQ